MKKIVDVENFVGNGKTVNFELAGDATPQDVGRKVLELCGDEYDETMSIRVGIYNEIGRLIGWYRGNLITSGRGNPWFKVTERKNAGVYRSVRYVLC